MNLTTGFIVRLVFRLSVLVTVLFGSSGCVTTTEINEGYGVTMEEEKPLVDQVKVED